MVFVALYSPLWNRDLSLFALQFLGSIALKLHFSDAVLEHVVLIAQVRIYGLSRTHLSLELLYLISQLLLLQKPQVLFEGKLLVLGLGGSIGT